MKKARGGGTDYGSENSEETAFVRRVVAPPPRKQPKTRKNVLAAVGVSLCVGGAMLVHSMASSSSSTAERLTGDALLMNADAMVLESQQAFAVPPVLQEGREFLLQIRGKNNLCMDDGGGWRSGSITTMVPCNPDNVNQVFVYNAATYQIRSARKPNLCLDDGGSTSAGSRRTHLWDCDPNNANQKFVYDAATQMFRNPTKNNLCLDDGGGTTQGGSQFTIYTCDLKNPNQRFGVMFRDDLLAEKEHVIDAVVNGARFVLRVQSKNNLCLDDGGGWTSGATQFRMNTCDFDNMDQIWVWDPVIKRIRSYKKPNMCLDDGGGATAGSSKFWLWTCDPNNANQNYVLDRALQVFRNPNKNNLCLDDGNAWESGPIKSQPWTCDVYNTNQHFEYALMPPLPVYEVPPLLQTGREFLLQIRGKNNLCMDDGGGLKAGESKLIMQSCNPSNPNQGFVYDAKSFQIRSVAKPRLCVDDGDVTGSGVARMVMADCDPDNRHQRFVYNADTQMFRNPTKGNLCVDDGGGVKSGSSQFWLWTCHNDNPNQRFEVKFRDEWLAEQQRAFDAVASGAKFLLRAQSKNNLCVDDGGATASGTTRMQLVTCDVENMSQVFVWDAAMRRIRSHKKTGLCIDDGGAPTAGSTKFWLWGCDLNNRNQDFVLDRATLQFRQPSKPNLCMDDGDSWRSGTHEMHLWTCDLYNPNQHFEYVLVPPLPVYDVPPVLKTDHEFLLKIHGKNSLCVDDGSGVKKGDTKFMAQPCNPSNINQMFVYDWKTYQIRSARKPNLCVDDGGASNPAGSNVILWECDVDNRNQRFLYDPATQKFRNPTKDKLCLDDGGGTTPGQTRFVMFTCDGSNPNQGFEIKFRDEWQAEQQRVIDAVAGGAKFIMRVPGKDNLCVDDGGTVAPASTKFQLSRCDTENVNQIFVWDSSIHRIRSSSKKGLCVDDGGGWVTGLVKFVLWHCDVANINQVFVYDKSTMLFRNPHKANLCMDDGGGTVAGQTKFHLWGCDVYNPNQHFEYVLVPISATLPPPTLAPIVSPSVTPAPATTETPPEPESTESNSTETTPTAATLPTDTETPSTNEPEPLPTQTSEVVPTTETPLQPSGFPDVDDEPTDEPNVTTNPSTAEPKFDDKVFNESDWNLLAPSDDTIDQVNMDNSEEITADEIYAFLSEIKHRAEHKYNVVSHKYDATLRCVTAGLQEFKTQRVSPTEYHALVKWMYTHCAVGQPTPITEEPSGSQSTPSGPIVHTYMTKLEFYYQICDHFMNERAEMFGKAEASRLRSELATISRKMLMSCIDEASNRFGTYTEYERPEHLHNAITWVQQECVHAT